MGYGIFRRRPRIVPKYSNQVYYMTPTVNPLAVNTYMSYITANQWLKTVVDGIEISRQKANGDVDFLNDVSVDNVDVIQWAYAQGE